MVSLQALFWLPVVFMIIPGLHLVKSALTPLLITAFLSCSRAVPPPHTTASIAWDSPITVATGGGYKGPWQQNDSRYDYVDDPSVALDEEGTAFVIWVDQRQKDVFLQKFPTSNASSPRQPVNVSRSPGTFSWLPRIVVSPRNSAEIFLLWQEIVFSGGSHGGETFFSWSRDGGATFSTPLNLSSSIGGDGKGRINRDIWHNGSLDLAVGPDGNTLHAAWTEYDGPLWYARSTNGGTSFSTPRQIKDASNELPARAPALAVDDQGAVWLAWTVGESASADIRLVRSHDNGDTFAPPVIVARTPGYSDAPKLASDASGTLHIAFADSTTPDPFGSYQIFYTQAAAGENLTFQPPREISRPSVAASRNASFPSMHLVGSNTLSVVYELYAGRDSRPRGLAIVLSRDTGRTFTAPDLIPGSAGPDGSFNGGQQGMLMRKLAGNRHGAIAVVNATFSPGVNSSILLIRGQLQN